MKKIQLFFLALLFSVATAAAQSVSVSGKVTYAEDGSPVIGARIQVKGTSTGTATDVNGAYKLTIPANAAQKVLVFSSMGLATQEIATPTSGTYDVEMTSDALAADEVVVTGYGSPKRAGTTVGSSVKVDAKAIENRASSSAIDALQGAVPGLQVYSSTGEAGATQSVRLHGIGSLGASSTPLYIVDGVQTDARTVLAMNPNDFESYTVLKDASATSIYGSRAANGVIFISTKRGSFNSKAKFTARGNYGLTSMADKSYYDNMMNTDQLFDLWQGWEGVILQPGYTENYKTNLVNNGFTQANGELWDTDWVSYMQPDNRPMKQADISVSGGGENVAYYLSGSYSDEQGTTIGNYFKRFTVRSNIDGKVNDWMKVGMNLQLGRDQQQTNANYGSNYLAGGLSYLYQPFYSPYTNEGEEPDVMPGINTYNPHYRAANNPDVYTRYGILGNTYMELTPVEGLTIRSSLGLDMGITDDEWMTYPSYLGAQGSGSYNRYTMYRTNTTITNTVEYAFDFKNEDHKLSLMVGQEGLNNRYDYWVGQSDGQSDDRLMNFQNGLQSFYDLDNAYNETTFLSFFGRADYGYKGKYFFDATVRNDASSKFSPENRDATFWSVGAMWNMKKENFLTDNDVITGLNVKASYGTQGNSAFGDYTNDGYIHTALQGTTTNYGNTPAWVVGSSGNSGLKWETQKKLTVGFNMDLWSKLSIGVEYYNRVTEDMLMSVPIPTTTGFESNFANVGSLANNGIDVNLSYHILQHKDYYLSANFNFNYNSEKITELFDGRSRYEIANTGVAYVVGEPVMFYYPIYAGVNPETGQMQWYKPYENEDGTIDADRHTTDNGVTSVYNEDYLKQNTGIRRYAPINGGFGISAGWKGISLQADFVYSLGKSLISNDLFFSENPTNFFGYNTSSSVADYWKKEGDVVYYPDWTQMPTMQFDTHLIQNASFMRMKNLTVAYTLPAKFLRKSKSLTGFKVFFTGRNLLTFTNKDFRGIDPEVDSNLTLGNIGNTKTFLFGVELYF